MGRPETSRPVVTKLRALCLAFPKTSEVSSWGHPNFRAGRRTFSSVFATPYGQGRWVSLWVDGRVDWRVVARLLDRSYRTVAIKRMIAALDRPRDN